MLRGVEGLGAAVEVGGEEGGGGGGFMFTTRVGGKGGGGVEGRVDQGRGLVEGELAFGGAGGEAEGFQMHLQGGVRVGGRFEEGGVGAGIEDVGLEDYAMGLGTMPMAKQATLMTVKTGEVLAERSSWLRKSRKVFWSMSHSLREGANARTKPRDFSSGRRWGRMMGMGRRWRAGGWDGCG